MVHVHDGEVQGGTAERSDVHRTDQCTRFTTGYVPDSNSGQRIVGPSVFGIAIATEIPDREGIRCGKVEQMHNFENILFRVPSYL